MAGRPRRYGILALTTIVICVLAIYVHRHRQGRTGAVDGLIVGATGAVQRQVSYLLRGVHSFVDEYIFVVNAKKENAQLKHQLEYLQVRLAALREVEIENTRLREALRFKNEIEEPLLAANVIAHDVSADYFGIRIDRGSEDGVEPGMGVISPAGLVGRILRVTDTYSDVLTVVDPTSNIDAIVQRTRARGIASGQAEQLSCELKYVDKNEDVGVSDVVVSSGFDSIFPKGLLIGYVTAVVPNPTGVLQKVSIRTAVDIYRLEEVFIVSPRKQTDKVS